MFVLYFEHYYYGEAEFGIITVSNNKEKLENHKNELIEKTKYVDDFRDKEHRKKYENFLKNQKLLKEFLESNRQALRPPFTLKSWEKPGDYLTDEEWNQYIDKLKDSIIDNTCQHYVSKFKKGCINQNKTFINNMFFTDLLNEPLPEFEFYIAKLYPPDETTYYEPESLKIVEVTEL